MVLQTPSARRVEVGVDEVGRGCLSHSVVAGACVLPHDIDVNDPMVALIKDSKKLSEKKRKLVEQFIKRVAVAWAVGEASVQEIDERNILKATFMAMHRALDTVYAACKFQHILVDGPHFKPYFQDKDSVDENKERYFVPNTCVLNGDAVHMNIAAASILAKCYRDDMVCRMVTDDATGHLAKYGFESHKGYGTKKHLDAIRAHGVTVYHRRTFAPVAAAIRTNRYIATRAPTSIDDHDGDGDGDGDGDHDGDGDGKSISETENQ